MNRGEIIALARSRLDDIEEPYGWSTANLQLWLNEAITEAAIRANLLVESSTDVGPIILVAGQLEYETACDFLLVTRAAIAGYPPLIQITRRELDELSCNWEAQGAGRPIYYITDALPRTIGVWPTPNTDFAGLELKLRIIRLPRTLGADTASPEIASYYHHHLVDWIRYRAFSRPDTDRFDINEAERAEADFTRYFGPRPSAKTLTHEQRNDFHIEPHIRF